MSEASSDTSSSNFNHLRDTIISQPTNTVHNFVCSCNKHGRTAVNGIFGSVSQNVYEMGQYLTFPDDIKGGFRAKFKIAADLFKKQYIRPVVSKSRNWSGRYLSDFGVNFGDILQLKCETGNFMIVEGVECYEYLPKKFETVDGLENKNCQPASIVIYSAFKNSGKTVFEKLIFWPNISLKKPKK